MVATTADMPATMSDIAMRASEPAPSSLPPLPLPLPPCGVSLGAAFGVVLGVLGTPPDAGADSGDLAC